MSVVLLPLVPAFELIQQVTLMNFMWFVNVLEISENLVLNILKENLKEKYLAYWALLTFKIVWSL